MGHAHYSLPFVEPTVERLLTEQGIIWRVCGLGYCIEHQQRGQAEVMYECMLVAKGLSNQANNPKQFDQGD